jgi:hypothetical protein
MTGQNNRFGNTAQGCLDGLTPDSSAVIKRASTDSSSESQENVGLLGLGHVDEEFVETEAGAP